MRMKTPPSAPVSNAYFKHRKIPKNPKSLFKIWRNARQAQIFSLDKAIWRRNTLCISSQINAGQRKKMCRDGVLIDFKQALRVPGATRSRFAAKRGEAMP